MRLYILYLSDVAGALKRIGQGTAGITFTKAITTMLASHNEAPHDP